MWSYAELSPDLNCASAVPERTLIFKAKFSTLVLASTSCTDIAACSPSQNNNIARQYHGSEYCSVKLIEGVEMGMRVELSVKSVSNALDGSPHIWMMPVAYSCATTTLTLPLFFSPSRKTRPQLQSAPGNSPQTASFPAVNLSLMSFTLRDPRFPEPSCPKSSVRSTKSTRHASSLSDSRHSLVVVGARASR